MDNIKMIQQIECTNLIFGQTCMSETDNDQSIINEPKTSIYKGLKHPRLKTDEERAKRREEKLEYAKKYYQQNKKKMQKQNNDAWKIRRKYLCEMGRDPRVVEFYENLKNEAIVENN